MVGCTILTDHTARKPSWNGKTALLQAQTLAAVILACMAWQRGQGILITACGNTKGVASSHAMLVHGMFVCMHMTGVYSMALSIT